MLEVSKTTPCNHPTQDREAGKCRANNQTGTANVLTKEQARVLETTAEMINKALVDQLIKAGQAATLPGRNPTMIRARLTRRHKRFRTKIAE